MLGLRCGECACVCDEFLAARKDVFSGREHQTLPFRTSMIQTSLHGANVLFKRIYIEHVIQCIRSRPGDCTMIAESTYDTS